MFIARQEKAETADQVQMEVWGTTPSQDSSEVLLPTPSDDERSAMEVAVKQSESSQSAGDQDMPNGDDVYRDIPRTGKIFDSDCIWC